jgi:small subunit ribosomal protein S1
VDVKVLDVDKERARVSLGIKQLEPNPWDSIEERYPVGTVIEGKIKNITPFGVFIGLDEGVDGLVHISDISWTKSPKHPSEVYEKGDVVQAVVLHIEKENQQVSLGIKQLTPDPWADLMETYKPGAPVLGKVVQMTSFGLFVELEEGVEALLRLSEIPKNARKDYQPGDLVEAAVAHVSKEERKIELSVRKMREEARHVRTNLGELIKEEIREDE